MHTPQGTFPKGEEEITGKAAPRKAAEKPRLITGYYCPYSVCVLFFSFCSFLSLSLPLPSTLKLLGPPPSCSLPVAVPISHHVGLRRSVTPAAENDRLELPALHSPFLPLEYQSILDDVAPRCDLGVYRARSNGYASSACCFIYRLVALHEYPPDFPCRTIGTPDAIENGTSGISFFPHLDGTQLDSALTLAVLDRVLHGQEPPRQDPGF